MKILTGLRCQKTGQGFTLLEVLLATVLLMLLLGAIAFNYSALQRGAALEEGVTQFESLLRFAQAQAAESGRKVQLVFEEEMEDDFTIVLSNLRLMWEPDPLGEPGNFVDLAIAGDLVRGIQTLVQIETVRPFEPGAEEVSETGPTNVVEAAEAAFADESDYQPPIMFYPDGSSDSAEITLVPRDEQDTRKVAVRLVGITGSIQRRFVGDETESNSSEEENAETQTKTQKPQSPVAGSPAVADPQPSEGDSEAK